MNQKQPVIAFVGIGLMGVHMARNLLKAGFALPLLGLNSILHC